MEERKSWKHKQAIEYLKGKRWYCIHCLKDMLLSYKYLHCKTQKHKNNLRQLKHGPLNRQVK